MKRLRVELADARQIRDHRDLAVRASVRKELMEEKYSKLDQLVAQAQADYGSKWRDPVDSSVGGSNDSKPQVFWWSNTDGREIKTEVKSSNQGGETDSGNDNDSHGAKSPTPSREGEVEISYSVSFICVIT